MIIKINYNEVNMLFEGFCLGLWTSLIIGLNIYSHIKEDTVAILFCSILLVITFFAAGLYIGEKSYIEKLKRGEIEK